MSDTISEGYKSDDIAPSWAGDVKSANGDESLPAEPRYDSHYDEAVDEMTMLLEDADGAPSGRAIIDVCMKIAKMLISKNKLYGDSAINPTRCFSKASTIEQINVRLDDKISRLMSAQPDETEDVELDLIGYLVLKQVAIQQQEKKNVRSKAKDAANGFGDS